jgi:hypothetical protein
MGRFKDIYIDLRNSEKVFEVVVSFDGTTDKDVYEFYNKKEAMDFAADKVANDKHDELTIDIRWKAVGMDIWGAVHPLTGRIKVLGGWK